MTAHNAEGDCARCGGAFVFVLIDSRAEHRESRGDFARCDGRLRALP